MKEVTSPHELVGTEDRMRRTGSVTLIDLNLALATPRVSARSAVQRRPTLGLGLVRSHRYVHESLHTVIIKGVIGDGDINALPRMFLSNKGRAIVLLHGRVASLPGLPRVRELCLILP